METVNFGQRLKDPYRPPRAESLTIEGWKRWFEREGRRKNFSGNPEHASVLIKRLYEGVERIYSRARQAMGKVFTSPIIVFNDNPQEGIACRDFQLGREFIIMNAKEFANRSHHPLYTPREIRTSRGELSFHGNSHDYFWLLGIEEGDEALYHELHGDVPTIPRESSLTEYDAQPHEMHSLIERLKAAEQEKLPQYTIDVLRSRYQAAMAWQRKRAMNPFAPIDVSINPASH